MPRVNLDQLVQRVQRLDRLCAQQIVSPGGDRAPSAAALIDQWGRAHWLRPRTVVGRELGENDLVILEASVSRRHAELYRDEVHGTWHVTDLGSTNGTFVEGRRIAAETALTDELRLTIGEVGFVFHARGAELFGRDGTASIKNTAAAGERGATDSATDGSVLMLLGSAPGGGGIVERGGTYVQLGPTQYALVELLAHRWFAEDQQANALRGFVRSIELITDLPWETPYAEDNNVKQLVRRVRRAFERAGLDDPVESRQGLGYRMRIPVQIHGS